ncbi:MAG: type II toxin-antitoxin system RelE/ParE family toxin [Betaproteobacteria bacterium]|nr:type II toxin-antitoxin system RelE/ParE family toxin [Betaproteobacteria bacterium]
MPNWIIAFASPRVESEILALPAGHVARFVRYAERMETWGPDLGMPHTRAMGGGLFELHVQAVEGIARLFFFTASDRRLILVHSFVKKTGKTPPGVLAIARRRMRQVIDG